MPSALFDAVVVCNVRRLRSVAARAPLPAAAVGVLVLLAPVALARVGRALGEGLAGGGDGVSVAVVVGPVLAAAAAGAALAVSFPGATSFGKQIAASPCDRVGAVVAALLVPAVIGSIAVLPSIVVASVALVHGLPGGPLAGASLSLAVVAALAAGAIAAEGALGAARGLRRRSLVVAAAASAWIAAGVVFGRPPLGPLAPVPDAIDGSGSQGVALAAPALTLVCLCFGWVRLAATRPGPRPARAGRPRLQIVRGRRRGVFAAVGALLLRRSDVRLAAMAAMLMAVVGTIVAVESAAPAPSPFLLATTTAMFGSVVCPLLLGGMLLEGRWLWWGGSRRRRLTVPAAELVSLAGAALPVVAAGVCAFAVSGVSWSAVGIVAAILVIGSSLAVVAGAAVPWRRDGAGDQLTTFVAFAALAIGTSLAVALVAPRLVALGIPDPLVVVLTCAACLGTAVGALGQRLRVPTR